MIPSHTEGLTALSKVEGPFDRPFDKSFGRLMIPSHTEGLTVLSEVEGLMALRKVEGLRCLRSFLSFDLEALDRLAAYLIYASLVGPWRSRLLHGISQAQLAVI
jgi:hypothetical protein